MQKQMKQAYFLENIIFKSPNWVDAFLMVKWTVGFENWKYFVLKIKGHLISKGLFGVFNSSEKRTKTSRPKVT